MFSSVATNRRRHRRCGFQQGREVIIMKTVWQMQGIVDCSPKVFLPGQPLYVGSTPLNIDAVAIR
jgi:hypothetical protein